MSNTDKIKELENHLKEVAMKLGVSGVSITRDKDLSLLTEKELVDEINVYINNINHIIDKKKSELIKVEQDLAVRESQLNIYLNTAKDMFQLKMEDPIKELEALIYTKNKEQELLIASYQTLLSNLSKNNEGA